MQPKTVLLLLLFLPPAALGFTAEELAAKNVEARGGVAKLRAIQSLRLSGTLAVSGGAGGGQLKLDYMALIERPQSVRYEADLQGLTQIQAYDGQQAWQINPFQGRKDPENLSADDAKGMGEDAADAVGALVDYQEKGYRLEYLGREDVDGTEAHKLRLTRPNGDLLFIYLDPDFFLEIRTVSRRIEHGVANETVTDFGDYEKIDGVYLPLALETGPKGSSDRQKIQFDKAEVNVTPDAAVFHFPQAHGAAAQGK